MDNGLISSSKHKFSVTLTLILFFLSFQISSFAVPRPDHVVICILENHSYQQIVGSGDAPYINELLLQSANMQEYYALTHPSQPNYLMLFSGGNQGETTDNLPTGTPWSTPNLGGSLINAGFTFASYSEGIPSPGSTVGASGAYARKHCPWINWQGTGTNQIPLSCNMSTSNFPSDYNTLPDVSFVIPNQNNDMHNGSDPTKIALGDTWVYDHLKSYIDWAQTHNSLFILTFDEDNFTPSNKVACMFVGSMVRQGNYYLHGYDHYDLLRTLEEMYGLPYAGNSANASSIEEIWMTPTTGINDPASISDISGMIYPNPVTDESRLIISCSDYKATGNIHLVVYDITGRMKSEEIIQLSPGSNNMPFRREGFTDGIYTYQIRDEKNILTTGKLVVD